VNKLPTVVEIRLPRVSCRRWQLKIVEALGAAPGIDARVRLVEPGAPPPAGLDLLFAFERIFVGRDEPMATDVVGPPPRAAGPSAPDLIVDLAGGDDHAAVPVLRPTCLGRRPLEGALAAVLDERVPVLALDLVTDAGARRIGLWPVAVEDRRNALRAASMILGRLAHMVSVAVERRVEAGLSIAADVDPTPGSEVGAPAVTTLFLRSLATRINRKLNRLAGGPRPDWRTVWRRRDPATAPLAPHSDPTPFRLLPDDGARFFADPFPWDMGDHTLLFVEEYPYATGRGILSVCEIDAAGRVSAPRPILEQDCHLSYPQIFERDGRMWMVPETSGRRTVELWRAERFPDDWRLHAVLLADVDLADATLEEIDGTWWMFGTARCPWGSSWDALHIYMAPSLEGPWTPLSPDPIVVDVRGARPGGRLLRDETGWLRPVQDSSRDYGCGLALTRIDRLDAGGFAEHPETRFATPAPLLGLHTWNFAPGRAGLFETMDVFADARAFGPERRLDLAPRA